MNGESNQNVFLAQIDASSFAEFEISEFEISRFIRLYMYHNGTVRLKSTVYPFLAAV